MAKQTELKNAIINKEFESVKELLRDTSDLNMDLKYDRGQTLLMYAVKNGDYTIAKLLISNGVDINIHNYSGETPLCIAVNSI